MKKVLLIVLVSILSWQTASAQAHANFNVDSLEYIMPNFSIGTVLFYNGGPGLRPVQQQMLLPEGRTIAILPLL